MKRETILLVVLFLLAFWSVSGAAVRKSHIYNSEGRVTVVRNNATLRVPIDMPVLAKDLLRSEDDGIIEVSFFGWAGLYMGPSTHCVVEKITESDVRVYIPKGSVRVNLKDVPSGGFFQLNTDALRAEVSETKYSAVNGAAFILAITEKDGKPFTKMTIKEGLVKVYSNESTSGINAIQHQTVEMAKGSYAPSVRGAFEDEVTEAEEAGGIYMPPAEDTGPLG